MAPRVDFFSEYLSSVEARRERLLSMGLPDAVVDACLEGVGAASQDLLMTAVVWAFDRDASLWVADVLEAMAGMVRESHRATGGPS
jgi:hypothetical protein